MMAVMGPSSRIGVIGGGSSDGILSSRIGVIGGVGSDGIASSGLD